MAVPDLDWLNKYIVRDPYTGASRLDMEALEKSADLRRYLGLVWDSGYGAGFEDGDGDSYVSQAHVNPYK